ncbi:amino acid/amide ABC transporter substrate-binding protein (HAAT family) [Saccharopolyspora erythraea NRRL 2338]|nr:ABC transporter substrate-binding protein [Saccharopolyspora erythraea]PFG97814.1 amino acid/amide ABC transporter substrate-binding protein (HAAT family) [Saccharopolyspora erythraea NRRL 2338]QRK87953.1 ABC transporter substrate-binding protein [Saccharopolyspora erythraea]
MMRHRHLAALAASVLLVTTACAGGGAGNPQELTIGVAQPLSGPVASSGQAVAHGAEIAAEEINAAGGVNGKRIALRIEDDANDPATCVNVAQKLVNEAQVPVVMGGWGSSCTLAMQPILERASVPLLVETSSSDKVTDKDQSGGEWTFRLSPTSSMEAVALEPVLKGMQIKKAYTLSVNNDFGLGAARHFGETLTRTGAQVVGGAKFEQNEQSFSTFVTQAIASGADTWVVTTDASQIALLLKEARGQGATARIITTGGSNSPVQVVQLAGPQAAEGSYATMFFASFDPSKAAAPQEAERFIAAWNAKGYNPGEAPEGVRGYQGIKVIAAAMGAAQNPADPKSVRDALAGVSVPGAIYGDIRFQTWRNLVNQTVPPVYLVRTVNGQVELVGTGQPPY